MGEWMAPLIDDPSRSCCYVADGGESLQSEWLASLLTKRGADGKIDTKTLDLAVMGSKTADAQAKRFHDALDELASLCEEAGVLDSSRAAIASSASSSHRARATTVLRTRARQRA